MTWNGISAPRSDGYSFISGRPGFLFISIASAALNYWRLKIEDWRFVVVAALNHFDSFHPQYRLHRIWGADRVKCRFLVPRTLLRQDRIYHTFLLRGLQQGSSNQLQNGGAFCRKPKAEYLTPYTLNLTPIFSSIPDCIKIPALNYFQLCHLAYFNRPSSVS